MTMWQRFNRLSPDLVATLSRFPLAVGLLALGTILSLAGINELVDLESEHWARLIVGVFTGAIFAVAGRLFTETRPDRPILARFLAYALPIVIIVAFQPDMSSQWVPYGLPVVAFLWLSLSASTAIGRGEARAEAQQRYWSLNNAAIATAALALTAFAVLAIGTVAIERSLVILFGLDTEAVFYRWIMPVTGLFLVPVYWLSTLPRPGSVAGEALVAPEFLQRASGFLGPFVLVPVLLAYALILLAYCVQIGLTRSLPNGMLGWMVLGFTVTGAATWLVVYPRFLDRQPVIRFFRRSWWWLTLVPLGLFALAVWQRIDAYGLTPERLILVWAGIWAALLSLIFLLGRGDIRLIPGLAAGVILLSTIGPWNLEALPRADQASRLATALSQLPDSSPEAAVQARSAIDYLAYEGSEGRAMLNATLAPRGVAYDSATGNTEAVAQALGLPPQSGDIAPRRYLIRDREQPVDVAATPWFRSAFSIYTAEVDTAPGLRMMVAGAALRIATRGQPFAIGSDVDLGAWLAHQSDEHLSRPALDFEIDGVGYRMVVDDISFSGDIQAVSEVYSLSGTLFSGEPVAEVSATPQDPPAPAR